MFIRFADIGGIDNRYC